MDVNRCLCVLLEDTVGLGLNQKCHGTENVVSGLVKADATGQRLIRGRTHFPPPCPSLTGSGETGERKRNVIVFPPAARPPEGG